MPYTVTKEKIEEILSNKPKITFKKIAKTITCSTKQIGTKVHNYKPWKTSLKSCKAD